MVDATGYPAGNINYCPRCGCSEIEYNNHWNFGDGVLTCKCGCSVYIIASDRDVSKEE